MRIRIFHHNLIRTIIFACIGVMAIVSFYFVRNSGLESEPSFFVVMTTLLLWPLKIAGDFTSKIFGIVTIITAFIWWWLIAIVIEKGITILRTGKKRGV